MTLSEKRDQLVTKLAAIENPQERFSYVIDQGRRKAGFDPQLKTEEHRVEGCLSKLWFVAEHRDGCCYFRADSDSMVVKAIAGILCDFYSGHRPEEIVLIDPSFFAQVGITQHLSASRRNGLARLWERIREFAMSHQTEV